MTRTPRRLLVVAIVGLVLSGCGVTTIRSGAAAVIGDDRISTVVLQEVVARGLVDPQAQQQVGADRPGFQRSVLRRLIDHALLVRAASQTGVSVTGAQVDLAADRIAAQLGGPDRLRAEAAKAGIAPVDLRQTLSDVALRDAIADKLTADVPVPEAQLRQAYQQGIAAFDQVHSAHILVSDAQLAQTLLAEVKARPGRFAALAARLSIDPGSKDKGGDLGFQGRGALEPPFETAIFSAKPGSFVLAHSRVGYHVIHVIERRTTTLEQASPDLRRGLLSQQRTAAVGALLQRTAKQLGVRVIPRFGVWDPTTQNVIVAKTDGAKDFTRLERAPASLDPSLAPQPRP